MFLLKITISIIQPLDQGTILAKKRLYRKSFLEEVMVVLENETGKSDDTTLQCSRNYTPKSAIFNFAAPWKAVKSQIFENGSKKNFK
jgi:hypothetical protein